VNRRPHQCGENIRQVKVARRHPHDTSHQWDKGAHDSCETGQKHARNTISPDELCAALYQPWEAIEGPPSEDLSMVSMPEPERKAVACNCSEHCSNEQEPRRNISGGGERTDRKDES